MTTTEPSLAELRAAMESAWARYCQAQWLYTKAKTEAEREHWEERWNRERKRFKGLRDRVRALSGERDPDIERVERLELAAAAYRTARCIIH